jgi:uncharacterized protein (TIGR03083 family)
VEHATRLAAIERETQAFVDAVAAGPLDVQVPTCPDFTVDVLAAHVGRFCSWWTHVLCEGTGRPKPPYSEELGDTSRVDWLRAIREHLLAELAVTPPETVTWSWYPANQSAAFVARRVSHELAIHRVDAQLARGPADPVEPELAADGIEEIFVLFYAVDRVRGGDAPRPHGETLHIHGNDYVPAEWLLTFTDDGVDVRHEHAKGDLALRGAVSDLEMVLYQRPTVGRVERFGDERVLETFHRHFTFV